MKIAFLGTGNLAVALGKVWTAAGHEIFVAGRSSDNSAKAAAAFSGTAVEPAALAAVADVIVVALAWEGLPSMLSTAGATEGAFAGKTVIDCTNAVDYATGRLKPETGSAAELVASLAPGAHVVKALHLFAGTSWPGRTTDGPVVAVCGDDSGALEVVGELVEELGGRAVVVGDLSASRQLEEAAGFVMRVVTAGHDPRSAVPEVRVGESH
ncbi:NADPH-dependent F420 reductase [Kribbella sp. NPDC051620]|uniref:NADPH-dependent F420 reductase n=1 Tax=Kribbella sp. NPDC051620 TaxID=3364120 RepID=UPI0037B0AB12